MSAQTSQAPFAAIDLDASALPSPFYPRGPSPYEDDAALGLLHEDSPPSLTASGSSDDGSSPSSASERHQRRHHHRQHSVEHAFAALSASQKANVDAALVDEHMSPWSNGDVVDPSRDVDWASPFAAATAHSFSSATPGEAAHHRLPEQALAMLTSPSSSSSQRDDTESKSALRAASQKMAEGIRGGQRRLSDASSANASSVMWGHGQKQPPTSDEQMFDSLIEEDSFDPPSTQASDYGDSPQPSQSQNGRNLSSVFDELRLPGASASPADGRPSANGPVKVEPTDATRPAAGAGQASEGSGASEEAATLPANGAMPSIDAAKATIGRDARPASSVAKSGLPQHPHNTYSDGEVVFSASTVVRPEVDGLADLQIHVHGIAARGAKSRVETQIKAHLELVRPRNGGSEQSGQSSSSSWDRVGSFTHLKLPPLSATKRKTKKNQQSTSEIPKEKTLYLDVAVVNASPPHQRAFACQSCSERERKRSDRRKNGRAKSGPAPSEEEMRRLGVDPSAANAAEIAAERLTQEESKRIILFNCGDYLEFKDGHAELPTRITCYCRHHKEKLGFCILFTMRNWKGKTVACGSTPAIMITDDHKSSAALERSRREAAGTSGTASTPTTRTSVGPSTAEQDTGSHVSGPPSRQSSALPDQSRAASVETTAQAESTGAGSRAKPRKSRPKPYDGQRRGTISSNSGTNAAPFATPSSNVASPSPGAEPSASSVDLVQALAAIGQERALLQQQAPQNDSLPGAQDAFSSQPNHLMNEDPSGPSLMGMNSQPAGPAGWPTAKQPPTNLQHGMPTNGRQDLHHLPSQIDNMLLQGSISPDTLVTNPLSLPGLDFTNSVVAQQMLAILGQQGLVPRGPLHHGHQQPQVMPQTPAATISKIIPGEGPTTGGIEVTILGSHFTDGLTCFFGDLAATSTRVWASNTLICVLPPSPSPGPVAVTLKTAQEMQQQQATGFLPPRAPNGPLQLFTYVDKSDTQLMELALQVVGFQQTRTMQVPRDIALRLLASGQGSINSNFAAQQQQQPHSAPNQYQAREAVTGLFAAAAGQGDSGAAGFQDTIINFLQLLEVDNGVIPRRLDAIRLANGNGHTLLHLSVVLGFHRLATKLLSLGCPVDARDRNGLTALHLAAINGRAGLTRILLEHGARAGVRCLHGQTPLFYAQHEDHADVQAILAETYLDHGLISDDDLSCSEAEDDAIVDDDNVSSSELDWSSDEEDDEGADPEDEEAEHIFSTQLTPDSNEATPRPPSTPLIGGGNRDDKSAMAASDEKALEKHREAHQTSTTALQAFANKLPGGFGGLLGRTAALQDRIFPMALQQRLQAVPVFHAMAPEMPSSMLNWASGDSEQRGKKGETSGNGEKSEDNAPSQSTTTANEHDASRLMNLWRTIVEETGVLWTNGVQFHQQQQSQQQQQQQQQPPPAYEEAAKPAQQDDQGETRGDAAPQPPTEAEAVTATATQSAPSAMSRPVRRPTAPSRRSSTSSLDSAVSSSASTVEPAAPAPPRRRRMGVEDDWMLRWFWLPCLFLVVLVAFFSTGPLSISGLATYIPQLGRL